MTWNQEYYDILEFFYWEPQHLGKKRPVDGAAGLPLTLKESQDKLRRLEVPLNHQFNLFFRLVPNAMLNRFFSKVFGQALSGQFEFMGRELQEYLGLKDAMQPDIFFLDDNNLVSLELKLDYKSGLEQVMKYAILNWMEWKKSGKEKKYFLAFIGKSNFSSLWHEKFPDIEALKQALPSFEIPDKTRNGNLDIGKHREEIQHLAQEMNIAFINYQSISEFLISERNSVDIEHEYADVYIKLLDGMVDELKIRGLAGADSRRKDT